MRSPAGSPQISTAAIKNKTKYMEFCPAAIGTATSLLDARIRRRADAQEPHLVSLCCRHVSSATSPSRQRLTLNSISVVGGVCVVYIPWYYKNVIIKPYHNFPEPVAKKLRKALFYSRGKWLDIREANKYFRQALAAAEEEGMDPFSDEIMGVKYTIAALFEDAGYYSLAVDVLEIMRSDCTKWVDEFSDRHWNDGDRSRVKKNLVQINLKLGQLYDVKYVNEPENGGKRLTEAVESALREKQRRDKEGLKPGEGEWLTSDEMGGALEGESRCIRPPMGTSH
jgi:hypothetical protein